MSQPTFKRRKLAHALPQWIPRMALKAEDDIQHPEVAAYRKTSLLFNELRAEVYNALKRRHQKFEQERAISKRIAENNPLTFPNKGEASNNYSNPQSPETESVDQNSQSNKVTPNLHPLPVCVKGIDVEDKDIDGRNGTSYICVGIEMSAELPPISL
eukprot:762569-Hanusia_phi.AAC.3